MEAITVKAGDIDRCPERVLRAAHYRIGADGAAHCGHNRVALLIPEPVVIAAGDGVAIAVMQPARFVEVPSSGGLAALQGFVGGDIEAQSMPLGHSAYGDEEAKLTSKPRNPDADVLWKRWVREAGAMNVPGDYWAGPCVIVGPLDREGNDTDVTPAFVELVRSMAVRISQQDAVGALLAEAAHAGEPSGERMLRSAAARVVGHGVAQSLTPRQAAAVVVHEGWDWRTVLRINS